MSMLSRINALQASLKKLMEDMEKEDVRFRSALYHGKDTGESIERIEIIREMIEGTLAEIVGQYHRHGLPWYVDFAASVQDGWDSPPANHSETSRSEKTAGQNDVYISGNCPVCQYTGKVCKCEK